jgi:hypothetical protein
LRRRGGGILAGLCRRRAAGRLLQPGSSGPFNRQNASKVSHKPAVRARIAELQERSAERAVVHLEWVQHELVNVARGKTPSKTIVNAKGEKEETFDRAAALSTLARTLGAGADVQVTAVASAHASASVEITDMSSAELARRISSIIEDAAAQGMDEPIDVTPAPASIDRAPAAVLPPPKERARRAIMHSIDLARELRSDPDALRYFHFSLVELTQVIAEEVAAHA